MLSVLDRLLNDDHPKWWPLHHEWQKTHAALVESRATQGGSDELQIVDLRPLFRQIREVGRSGTFRALNDSETAWETVKPWMSGLTWQEGYAEEERSWDAARALWHRVSARADFTHFQNSGKDLLRGICVSLEKESGSVTPLVMYPLSGEFTDFLLAGSLLNQIVNVIMRRTTPIFEGSIRRDLVPSHILRRVVQPFSNELRALTYACLRRCNEPLDEWHRATMLAHLLDPQLALFAIKHQFWHPAPEPGLTDRERQVHTAVGARAITERNALKAKQDFRQRAGAISHQQKRGPKAGSHNTLSADARALDNYLLDRLRHGVSAQMMAIDAEARRLYRRYKRDHSAELNERIVLDRLRRYPESPKMGATGS